MSTPKIKLSSTGDGTSTSLKIQLLGMIGSGDCSGEHVISVTELPTEDIDKDAFYKLTKEVPFTDCIFVSGDDVIPYVALLTAFGEVATANTIPTKTTENIKVTGDECHFYYIEDEDDVFVYGDFGSTGSNSWTVCSALFGVHYNGKITDISEATTEGYYALGGGTVIQYYRWEETEASLDDVIAFDGSATSLGPGCAGLYYVKTKPTEDIKVTNMGTGPICLYYVEGDNDIFLYADLESTGTNSWVSLSTVLSDDSTTYTFKGAITDSTQATETGYYALITEAKSGFEEYIIPKGMAKISDIPSTYIVKNSDSLPTGVTEGSLGVVTHGSSKLSGVAIEISWNRITLSDYSVKYIWSDGTNTYYSDGSTQYILNKKNFTWEAKSWNGLTEFFGECVWSDGTNIYYSYDSAQYVLNKETSTWETKTWNGFVPPDGSYIWSDGINAYYSNNTNQYILNKDTSTWETRSWNGLTDFGCERVWSDGTNTYYSNDSAHYVLNREIFTWEKKTWNGLTSFDGEYIWSDDTNTYYSNHTIQYVLNKATATWENKIWDGMTTPYGKWIWSDGTHSYFSWNRTTWLLAPSAVLYRYVDGYWETVSDIGEAALTTKIIRDSGTYNASDDGVQGYSKVTVNMPAVYMTTSLDDVPSTAPNGSMAIIWEVNE